MTLMQILQRPTNTILNSPALNKTILILMNDLRMTFWRRSASSFVNNLRQQLSSEMGRKSFTVEGFSFLGIKVIKDELRQSKETLPSQKL